MAQRDYVRKKPQRKNKSRNISNFMMVIAIILVILFVAILYFVTTNKANKPQVIPANITEKAQDPLPVKEEERWTYLKELENPNNHQPIQEQSKPLQQERQQFLDNFVNEKSTQSVVTTPPAQTKTDNTVGQQNTTQTGNWLLQCGAFKDKNNAESVKAKLAMLGITSFVKSDKLFRVLTGPYQSKIDAEKTITTLKSNGISCSITNTN